MSQSRPNDCKIVDHFAGQRVLVVGLGRFGGGVGVTRWLASQGAQVTVTDLADRESLEESVAALADPNVSLCLGSHDGIDPSAFDLVVLNPAVNKSASPFFREIDRRGVAWTTELNLFVQRCHAFVIGVTGSFGKSTTCAMLHEVLQRACRRDEVALTQVHLGGNIGRSLLPDLPSIRPTDVVILEMSSAQLEDLPRTGWTPNLAVITNLWPQHLDRYVSLETYARAKLNIVGGTARRQSIIVGDVHPDVLPWLDERVGENRARVVNVPDDPIKCRLRLPGMHNRTNAACVDTVCRQLGIPDHTIREGLEEFRGLPHRLELVRTLTGVEYYNDSKSTAPRATMVSLQAVEEMLRERDGEGATQPQPSERRRIIAIIGGQKKDVSADLLVEALIRSCRLVICTGESGPAMAEAIRQRMRIADADVIGRDCTCSVMECENLETAAAGARDQARAGDIVLFSPAAPSFDRYHNFNERGGHFVRIVETF